MPDHPAAMQGASRPDHKMLTRPGRVRRHRDICGNMKVAEASRPGREAKNMLADLFRTSMANRRPLRIGVLLDGAILPRWIEQVIHQIQASNFARLDLLVFNAAAEADASRGSRRWSIFGTLAGSQVRASLGYWLYCKLDKWIFQQANDPLQPVDCTARLGGIESIRVTPVTKAHVHRFGPADVEKIRARDLDVILRFGFNILRGEILDAAGCGVWSYHHGDNEYYRGGPACFWELYERNTFSGVTLQVLAEDIDAGLVLGKAVFSTTRMPSLVQNRFTPYWGAVTLVIQNLYRLHTLGWDALKQRSVPSPRYLGKRRLYGAPTNLEVGRWLAAAGLQLARMTATRLIFGKKVPLWYIGIRQGDEPLYRAGEGTVPQGFQWLTPPTGHFYADPFLMRVAGRTWLFFEDFLFRESRGIIACSEVGPAGQIGDCAAVLKSDRHLSYPFVFEHEGHIYMIPESSEAGTVQLYQATQFPYQWHLRRDLFRGKAVDTTLLINDGTFWFFTSLYAQAGKGRSLCLFYSDSLDGEWQSHPCNPLSMDVRNARSAGRIVVRDGKLMRISQNGAGAYGSSLNFHEIVTITKDDYREVLVKSVAPWDPRFSGIHTYDSCGDIEVVDGLTEGSARVQMRSGELPSTRA